MAVMAREAWTEERLDDLNAHMDKGFERLDQDIREVKGEVHGLRSEMNGLRTEMSSRFDSMQRILVIGLASILASTVASVIGAVIATQL
jgi:hypothetical protein